MTHYKNSQQGSVLVLAFIMVFVLIVISGSFMINVGLNQKSVITAKEDIRGTAMLQAAVSRSLQELNRLSVTEIDNIQSVTDGNKDGKINEKIGNSNYTVKIQPINSAEVRGGLRLLIHAKAGTVERFALAVVQPSITEVTTVGADQIPVTTPGNPFDHVLYQGGETTGSTFFSLGGTGAQRDELRGFPPRDVVDPTKYPSLYPSNAIKNVGGKNVVDPAKLPVEGGNVYIGDDFKLQGDSKVANNSTLRADGTVTDESTAVDITAQNLTIADQNTTKNPGLDNPIIPNYAADPNVVNIRPGDFKASANIEGSTAFLFGVKADIPSSGAANYKHKGAPTHIFRMDSNDTNVKDTTQRHDFFIEDVFAASSGLGFKAGSGTDLDQEPNYDGKGGKVIQVQPSGNRKTYLIDGNAWLHNSGTFSFILADQPVDSAGKPTSDPLKKDGTQITIVAQGDIFISDNFLYENIQKDAIAFIAIKRKEDYPDEFGVPSGNQASESSGKIQFGDLKFGTTFRFSGFMFAEDNFEAVNVNNNLFIYGNMTAGNEVRVTKGVGANRKALVLDFDARLEKNLISLPGIPANPTTAAITIVKEVPNTVNQIIVHSKSYHIRVMSDISVEQGKKLDPSFQ